MNSSKPRFRSPLLRAIPIVNKNDHATKVEKRTKLLIAGVVFLLALILVWYFGKGGIGFPLYWLHDYLYLPIKGYTFSYFYPDSWIWWGAVFTLLGLWMVSYLRDKSFVLMPHKWLIQQMIHTYMLSAVLVHSLRFTAVFRHRFNLYPTLLIDKVKLDRQNALYKLREQASKQDCNQTADLTNLLIKLLFVDKNEQTQMEAAAYWHEALLALEIQDCKYAVAASKKAKEVLKKTWPLITFSAHVAKPSEAIPFDKECLLWSVYFLANDPATKPMVDKAWLIELIDHQRAALYIQQLPETFTTLHAKALGKLSLTIALHTGIAFDSPIPTVGYLEAFEVTSLALRLRPINTLISQLVENLPTVEQHHAAAWLTHKHALKLQEEVEETINRGPNSGQNELILKSTDLASANRIIKTRYNAAGLSSETAYPVNTCKYLVTEYDPVEYDEKIYENTSINLPLRERADAALVLVLVGIFLLTPVFFWWTGVKLANQANLFEGEVVFPIRDERVLVNIRDDLPELPLLDGVLHEDGLVYISQTGGTLHKYNPATGLWSQEQPLDGNSAINHDFVILRSGCGDDPLSDHADSCPDTGSLWAVTADGGLIRKNGRSWEIIASDTKFRGAGGQLMTSANLNTAAISEDDKWLVVGTHQDGIGIYNLETHEWYPVPDNVIQGLPSLQITHLLVWHDRFWIGTPDGLVSLMISNGIPLLDSNDVISANILDLDIGLDDSLWILGNIPCEESGDDCLWLGQKTGLSNPPKTILSQANQYIDLNQTALTFAQYQDDTLIVAGETGIYSYQPLSHSWHQLFDRDVWATLPLMDKTGFYFAFLDGIGLIENEQITTWEMPEHNITKLVYDESDVLALTQQGNVYALGGQSITVTAVFTGTRTQIAPTTFTQAVGSGDNVLFAGPDGALLHDVVTRSYQDILPDDLPDWLTQSDIRFFDTGNYVYALTATDSGRSQIYTLPTSDLFNHDYFTSGDIENASSRITADIVSHVWVWDDQSIGVLIDEGSVYHFGPQNQTREIGAALDNVDNAMIVDVTTVNDEMVLALPTGLLRYDYNDRRLVDGTNYENLQAIEGFGNTLLLITEDGQLWQDTNSNSQIIGGEGFQIGDASLSDAFLSGQFIYLGGHGQVEQYDMGSRQITQRWDLAGNGNVRLKGVVGGNPVVLTNGRLYWGDKELNGTGVVTDASLDNQYIWAVRNGENGRYLIGYALANPLSVIDQRCFFHNSQMGGAVTTLLDARELSGGRIAVSTDDGLRFYDPAARSWFRGPANIMPNGGRVYRLGEYLTMVSTDGEQVWVVKLTDIAIPHSCSDDLVTFHNLDTETVRNITIDEVRGQAAWITSDQAVAQWQNGSVTELLPAVTTGPDTTALHRMYDRGAIIIFTTATDIWLYDLPQRRWQQVQLNFTGSRPIIDTINLENSGNQETVVVRGRNRSFYLGTFNWGETAVSLSLVFSPDTNLFNISPSALLDIQSRSADLWTFVLTDSVRYYNPQQRQWEDSVSLNQNDPTLSFQRIFDRGILVGKNDSVWQIAQDTSTEPTRFVSYTLQKDEITYLDNTAAIWRWQQDGSVLRCSLSSNYECESEISSFWLDPATVRRAYIWDDLRLFATNAGWSAFDSNNNQEALLPSNVANLSPNVIVRHQGDQLWFYDNDMLIILDQTGNTLSTNAFSGVSKLIYDADSQPWVQFSNEWQVWQKGSFQSITNTLHLFAFEDTPVTGIDTDGYPYSWHNNVFVRELFPLPPEIDQNALVGLWQADEQDWWALAETEAYHLVEGMCHPETLTRFVTATPTAIPVGTPVPIDTLTLQSSSTPFPTFTVTPAPTATPIPVPCFVTANQVDLQQYLNGSKQIIRAEVTAINLQLLLNNYMMLQVRPDGQIQTSNSSFWQPLDLATDHWATLQNLIATLPVGGTAFNPVTSLITIGTGELVAVRPSGNTILANEAANQFGLPPALNVNWLRWNRTSQDFSIVTPTGPLTLPRDQFVVNGKLLFESIEAILVENGNNLYTANEHGVWLYSSDNLSLANPSIVYYPLELRLPIDAAHGRFLVANGDYFPGESTLSAIQQSHVIVTDGITFQESIRDQSIIASGIPNISILQSNGFIWDSNRRGLAFNDSGLLLQSDAGIHPVDELVNFDQSAGRIFYETGKGLFLQDGDNWYRPSGGGWLAANDPTDGRLLVNNAIWQWQLVNNNMRVTLTGSSQNFAYQQDSNQFGFSSDRLLAASAHENQLFVATEAFLEIATQPVQVGNLTANRLPPITSNSLESFAGLYSYNDDGATRWDEEQQKFLPISETSDPRQYRELFQTDRLHFTYDNSEAIPVVKALRVDDIQGGSHWIAFGFDNGRFPFDVITAVSAYNNQLFVGSSVGLQMYSGLNTGLNDLQALYDLRRQPTTSTFAPVDQVGIPRAEQTLLRAFSNDACIQTSNGYNFQRCDSPAQLNMRLRVQTDLWQWWQTADKQVVGSYYDFQDVLIEKEIRIKNGRFPHDMLYDVVICQGQAVNLWQNGWISLYPNDTLDLSNNVQIYTSLEDSPPWRLICLNKNLSLPTTLVLSGLYAQVGIDEFAKLWQYDQEGWIPTPSETYQLALVDHVNNPPVLERGRLRIFNSDAEGYQFQQRTIDNQWHDLNWEAGRLAIDHWQQLEAVDGALWVATPDGLLPFTRTVDGQAKINPDNILIVRDPAASCRITDMATEAGQTWLRCNADTNQVYQGFLDDLSDREVFRRVSIDPFIEQTFVSKEESGFWQIRLIGHAGGNPGSLEIRLHEEVVSLVGGKFAFDTLNSLAFLEAMPSNIGTEEGGWFQIEGDSWHVRHWQRPQQFAVDPQQTMTVGKTLVGISDPDFALCLEQEDGFKYFFADRDPETALECPEFMAEDSLWRYQHSGGQLVITVLESEGGNGIREMENGRFTDDIIIGPPATGKVITGDVFYLLPTRAGVLQMNETKQRVLFYAAPFNGLNNSPLSALSAASQPPTYAGLDAIYNLDVVRQPLLPLALPGNANPDLLSFGPYALTQIQWHIKDQYGWNLLDTSVPQTLRPNTLPINVGEYNKYISNYEKWQRPSPWLTLQMTSEVIEFSTETQVTFQIDLPIDFSIQTMPILFLDRLILVGDNEVLGINLEQGMVQIMRSP